MKVPREDAVRTRKSPLAVAKETFYIKAWRYALYKSLKPNSPDGGVGPGAPPEERLSGWVKANLHRVTGADNTKSFMNLMIFAIPDQPA